MLLALRFSMADFLFFTTHFDLPTFFWWFSFNRSFCWWKMIYGGPNDWTRVEHLNFLYATWSFVLLNGQIGWFSFIPFPQCGKCLLVSWPRYHNMLIASKTPPFDPAWTLSLVMSCSRPVASWRSNIIWFSHLYFIFPFKSSMASYFISGFYSVSI